MTATDTTPTKAHARLSPSGAHRWKDIRGYEGRYQISDHGEVRNTKTMRLRALHTRARDGYVEVSLGSGLGKKTLKVHRLVAEAFIPNPEGLPQVDHRFGVRSDNRVTELLWSNQPANQKNRHQTRAASGRVGAHTSISKTNPFRSSVRVNGVKKHLGVFPTAEAAAAARQRFLENNHV